MTIVLQVYTGFLEFLPHGLGQAWRRTASDIDISTTFVRENSPRIECVHSRGGDIYGLAYSDVIRSRVRCMVESGMKDWQ